MLTSIDILAFKILYRIANLNNLKNKANSHIITYGLLKYIESYILVK